MEIYQALENDHRDVKQLLENLVSDTLELERRRQLVSEIRDALIPHSRAEEAVFYNSIRDIGDGSEIITHSYKDHLAAEGLLRTLQTMEVFDAKGLEVAKKLKKALEDHIDDEETRVFPIAKAFFTQEEAEKLGRAFEEMKPAIKEENIVGTTWDLIVNLMPTRMRSSLQKFKESSRVK
jgi:hemerythrin superfamily protein